MQLTFFASYSYSAEAQPRPAAPPLQKLGNVPSFRRMEISPKDDTVTRKSRHYTKGKDVHDSSFRIDRPLARIGTAELSLAKSVCTATGVHDYDEAITPPGPLALAL
ncbi:MAG: hypothetical protein HYZ50_00030 [Deltaproteobacteria bacterium]|nr:hypothetical protein [Deltaproteobacteria bacterium]